MRKEATTLRDKFNEGKETPVRERVETISTTKIRTTMERSATNGIKEGRKLKTLATMELEKHYKDESLNTRQYMQFVHVRHRIKK
jgi:hypothetical protein